MYNWTITSKLFRLCVTVPKLVIVVAEVDAFLIIGAKLVTWTYLFTSLVTSYTANLSLLAVAFPISVSPLISRPTTGTGPDGDATLIPSSSLDVDALTPVTSPCGIVGNVCRFKSPSIYWAPKSRTFAFSGRRNCFLA